MKTIHELSDEYRNFSGYDPSPTVISNNTDIFSDIKLRIDKLVNSVPSGCKLVEVYLFFRCRQRFKLFVKNLDSEIKTDEKGKMYCDYKNIRFLAYFPEGIIE